MPKPSNQRPTVKGTCGHSCDEWPQVTRGPAQCVVCDVCNDWIPIAEKPVQLSIDELLGPVK